jgi:hypothetical protein
LTLTSLGLGFTRRRDDHCVYSKQVLSDHVHLCSELYVVDMLLVGNNRDVIQGGVKSQLSSKFEMQDLGAANFILGMEIKRDRANMKL